jgi:hypothetical protein
MLFVIKTHLTQELSWFHVIAFTFLQVLHDIVILFALGRKILDIIHVGSQFVTKGMVVNLFLLRRITHIV